MCLGNESLHFFKGYLENVFYRMLSWRKVQAGIPSPSHFSKVLLCFQNQVVRVLFTRTLLLTLSLWLERCRTLGTGFEFLQLLWSPRLCLPADLGRRAVCWPVVSQRGPCFLSVHQVSFTFLLVQDLDATGEQWVAPTSAGSVLLEAKAWRHKGLNPASRKFPEQKQIPSTLSCGVWASAGAVTEHRSLF